MLKFSKTALWGEIIRMCAVALLLLTAAIQAKNHSKIYGSMSCQGKYWKTQQTYTLLPLNAAIWSSSIRIQLSTSNQVSECCSGYSCHLPLIVA